MVHTILHFNFTKYIQLTKKHTQSFNLSFVSLENICYFVSNI